MEDLIWQMVALGRMDFGLTKFSMKVAYDDDFGINAELYRLAWSMTHRPRQTVLRAGLVGWPRPIPRAMTDAGD
jgi:hypothetical protein